MVFGPVSLLYDNFRTLVKLSMMMVMMIMMIMMMMEGGGSYLSYRWVPVSAHF